MKKYYLLRLSSEEKFSAFGSSQAEISENKFKDKNNFKLLMEALGSNRYWQIQSEINSDFPINLERVELLEGATQTDGLEFSPKLINCPFLISEKFKNILDQFNTENISFFKTMVFNGNVEYFKYYLMHIKRLDDGIIDFKKSTFYFENELHGKGIKTFKNVTEMKDFFYENVGTDYGSIYLEKNKLTNLDIFCLGSGELVISEKLQQEITNQELLGLNILPGIKGVRAELNSSGMC
ncbi:imm11 family protein [Paraglaciecola sp. L3A3]|uniref:imm11 family protein n=1 Tax=Paraglaciecola sp. L3A3 TaxID=2686358 RepID=UPI00131BDCFF|nr:DUF1629 domain-containing protein [Paraglaciecola sp. L3A3]